MISRSDLRYEGASHVGTQHDVTYNSLMTFAGKGSDQASPAHDVRLVIDTIPALAWSARADGSVDFFNQRWLDYTGLSAEQARDWGWTVALHPDESTELLNYWRSVLAAGGPGEIEGRLRRFDGTYRWFLFRATPQVDHESKVVRWFGTNTDIEDRKREECLLAGQNLVLEMTARGVSLESSLEVLCRVVEQAAGGCCCTVMLIEPGGRKIQKIVAPSLPRSYNDQFAGISIDREGSPCTMAANRKTQVIASNLVDDTQWDKYGWRIAALGQGLKACWSTTILASNNQVLGTFGIYWREPRNPTDYDQKTISQVTHLAAVAIENNLKERSLQESEERFRRIVDTVPGFVCTLNAAGEVELLNRQTLEYFGKTLEELKNWQTSDAVHPDDLPQVIEAWRHAVETGEPYTMELRQRRADGVYRWFQSRALPTRDAQGRISGWYMLLTDIEHRKQAEERLRHEERDLRHLIDFIPQHVLVLDKDGTLLQANQVMLDYTGYTIEEMQARETDERVKRDIHPDDLERVRSERRHGLAHGVPFEMEKRMLGKDGCYRWFLFRYRPWLNASGDIVRWFATATDIEDRKRAEEALRSRGQSLQLMVDSIPGFIATMTANGELEVANRQSLEYFGMTIGELKNWATNGVIHPDDLEVLVKAIERGIGAGQPFDYDIRARRFDGVYRWQHARWHPQRDEAGGIVRWYALVTDIDERKRAEENLRRSEAYLTEAQHLSGTGSFGCKASSGEMFWSEETFRLFGYDRRIEPTVAAILQRVHPEDKARVQEHIDAAINEGKDCDLEYRLSLPNDSVKHVHLVAHAAKDEYGECELLGAVMDITENKLLKDRLQDENVALREQIDQAFMFEEIVGSSAALKKVLAAIVQVAPTESTVLIAGETGTGKELIARAIHKRSKRAGQPFVAVNCGSIPPSLIASELFGHEKGAFTGALQRRQGRFELARAGTIFLDEIGELPGETQVALLRVLQERQFERVGSSQVIPIDIRIIAATNRDLQSAIASGAFRADLFYRLNVFPIQLPPLRERIEDIPMLVEYFVKRYADKARKRITRIDKNTLKLCQAYRWPGNVRELQNIVERSVILCNTDTFFVEPSWLPSQGATQAPANPLTTTVRNYEKEIIEAALAESNGKVAGPNGAAAKLGIPRSTLETKIKQLKIKRVTVR